MISLRAAKIDELEMFDELDRQDHARHFVLQTGLEGHRQNYRDPKIHYLCVENSNAEFCGYIILVPEPENESVEFRRIIILPDKRGVGQIAIAEMEKFCKNALHAKRIWLDVFEDNEVGIHIYEKMGYMRFKEERLLGRKLHLYEKMLY